MLEQLLEWAFVRHLARLKKKKKKRYNEISPFNSFKGQLSGFHCHLRFVKILFYR